jgi:hypothetical protein
MPRISTRLFLAAGAAILVAGPVFAQSTTADPIGINAIEDPTISRQRGALSNATTGSLGDMPNSMRSKDTVGGWSLDGWLIDDTTGQ